jgi:hypothetical protein
VVTHTPDYTEGDTRPESEETKQSLRVEATVELPPGAEVQLTITYKAGRNAPVRSQVVNLSGGGEKSSKRLRFDLDSLPRTDLLFAIQSWIRSLWGWFTSLSIPPVYYLAGAILIYYIVRLIHLTDFPIFFFTDEAIHPIRAIDLVEASFASAGGEFLPTFFKNGGMYNLGTSVYLQILPALLGIRSAFVTRFISTTVTLLAAVSLGLSYGVIKNNRRGWIAVLVLSMIPAWFYHSRTAFETVEAVSFYSVFLYAYLRYRNGSFRWIYVSVAAAALAFYCYSPARVVMAAAAVAFLVSDFRFHWSNRKKLWLPILLGVLFCIPYFRFLYLHPGENEHHLSLLDSYWVKPVPFYEKIFTFLRTYLNGLNPVYWFFLNPTDLSRHIMKGMGHLGWFFLPFFAAGFILVIRKWKDTNYRLMLLAMLTAPVGAAVADISITRALFMVIPAAFFIALGIDYLIDWLKKHLPTFKLWGALVFLVLAAGNFIVLDISLTDGPTWFTDYGMGGMQYGGEQVFSRIKEIQEQNPDLHINMSPDWANGTDVVARFFLGDPVPIEMSGMSAFINEMKPSTEDTLFVIAQNDLTNIANSGKFEPMKVSDVIFYPDGTPGFVFARLKYKESAKLIFEQERASRKLMVPETVLINGVSAEGASSRLDMGSLQQAFDNKQDTLIRTEEANPLVVEVKLQHPIPVKMITAIVGGNATGFTVYAQTEDGSKTFSSSIIVNDKPQIQTVHVPVNLDQNVSRLRFEIRSIHDGEPTHVHLWDIKLE